MGNVSWEVKEEKMTFEQNRFKKVRELAMMTSGGRAFQAKERSVEDLSWKHALAV